MRLLRNLPIAVRLALASVAALGLLAVLAAVVLLAIAAQDRLDSRAAAATDAESDGRRAIAIMREVELASRSLDTAQTEADIARAAVPLDRLAERTGRTLVKLAQATADGTIREDVTRATQALQGVRDMAADKAALRRNLLAARAAFLPLRAETDHAAEAFRAAVEAAELAPETRVALRQLERTYMDAATGAREAAMQFLFTGDGGLLARMQEGDMAARNRAAAIGALGLPPEVKQAADQLFAVGLRERAAARSLFDAAARLIAASTGPAEAVRNLLEERLDTVVAAFADQAEATRGEAAAGLAAARRHVLLLAGGIAVVLLLSGVLTGRTVARPIVAMTRAVAAMAAGDVKVALGHAGRGGEVGRMAAALETLRKTLAHAFVQGQMLEQLPTGVMTADPADGFRITYANPAVRALLGRVAASLPVPVDALVGTSIDVFHAAPERQRALLADAANLPHRARIRIGAETMELIASPLRGADGTYVGPMLSWALLTRQEELAARFEQSVAGIAHTVGEAAAGMAATAAAMREAAAASGQRLELVSGASQAATGHVQSVAASAEELAASVREIGRQVAESARIAGAAVAEAEATDRSVAGLAEAAQRIGDVVELIRGIAGRTNLLALNATIEAARAGEAGRGFAVVANEVKMLANQTARATEDIGGQIAAMQGETTQAVAALRSIGGTICRMSEIATAIAGAVEEQSAATQEIARSVQEAAASTAQVDGTIGEVAAEVQRTGTQAEEVVGATGALGGQSATLSREVAGFLAALKAA